MYWHSAHFQLKFHSRIKRCKFNYLLDNSKFTLRTYDIKLFWFAGVAYWCFLFVHSDTRLIIFFFVFMALDISQSFWDIVWSIDVIFIDANGHIVCRFGSLLLISAGHAYTRPTKNHFTWLYNPF